MTSPMLPQALALAIGQPTDQRLGTVSAVTARGVDVSVGTGLVEGAAHLTSYNPAVGDTVIMARYADSWTVLGRLVGPGTPSDNLSPGTGIGSTLLDGMVLSGSNTDLVTTTGGPVAVPRYSLSFYHPADHWVLLLLTINWYGTVANDGLTVKVVEAAGSTVTSIDLLQAGAGGIGECSTFAVMAPPALGGAKRTYSLTLQRFTGSGTVRLYDPGGRIGSWFAYDAGDKIMVRTV